ncbi:MAG: TetR family transcriptional regulator [Acidimicrobiales bacterium]
MGSRGRQGPPSNTPAISRDLVLDAAFEILQTEGIERLTIRGLAAKLGVAVTAIYWHVGDKRALLDGLVERIVSEIGEAEVRGRGPEARILAIGRSLRRDLLERAHLVAVVHRQGRTAALFQPARRVLVRELTSAGLQGERVALAVHVILNHVIGSVLVDRQVERQPAQRQTPEELWTADDLPDAPELLLHLAHPVNPEELFDYSLAVLVRALLGR